MKKIKIFVDTGADLPLDAAKEFDIDCINFLCVFGDESYVALEELSNEEFFKKLLAADKLPTTSQTPPATMYEKLYNAAKEYDTVVYYTLSSKASGQYNNARLNCEQILEENPDADIRIIDTMSFSIYIGEAAIRLRKLLNAGMDIDEAIPESLKFIEANDAYVLVDDLKYLEMGGRITKTAAIVGGLLDIKPVLGIRNGLVEPLEKIRGKKKMYHKLMELIRENPEFDENSGEFYVVDSNKEYGDKMIETLKEEFGIENIVRRYEFGPIIGTHIGDGAVAVMFRKKGYDL
ncbi:MAG: DegV family protein [Ruminococcaceae bacterium]|nr:DegV family protein [Oscillospiraceae bacterium]